MAARVFDRACLVSADRKGGNKMTSKLMMKLSCATAALALTAISIAPTTGQPVRVKSGILDCDVSGGWGFIIRSQKPVQCLFTPDQPGPREPYVGAITKFGLDI